MYKKQPADGQGAIWIPTHELPRSNANGFYARLHSALNKAGFGDRIRAACRPYYDQSGHGRPGVDPEVIIRMWMVGFFEGIQSERAIASRCADSIEIRAFLGYRLTDETPNHSTISRFRQRIPLEVYYDLFDEILRALRKSHLIRGRKLGIDSSIIEANASLQSLSSRLTKEQYQDYIKRLAAESGVDTSDAAAVSRFDKKRKGRKSSNQEWENPHDPDAKIGRDKKGATRMIYKPEHTVDLDTGAIVHVDVRMGDAGDAGDLASRVGEAEGRLNDVLDREPDEATVQAVITDKGYFSTKEVRQLQDIGIEPVIPSPDWKRNQERMTDEDRTVLERARVIAGSSGGKMLLRQRAELVERSFAHVLRAGSLRRTTLRGRANIAKRYILGAICYNLSLLMRHLFGIGTPRQARAAVTTALCALVSAVSCFILHIARHMDRLPQNPLQSQPCFAADTTFPNAFRSTDS